MDRYVEKEGAIPKVQNLLNQAWVLSLAKSVLPPHAQATFNHFAEGLIGFHAHGGKVPKDDERKEKECTFVWSAVPIRSVRYCGQFTGDGVKHRREIVNRSP
jgi:hypothetical protein